MSFYILYWNLVLIEVILAFSSYCIKVVYFLLYDTMHCGCSDPSVFEHSTLIEKLACVVGWLGDDQLLDLVIKSLLWLYECCPR